MYARSYTDTERAAIPANYDGIAFGDAAIDAPGEIAKNTVESVPASATGGILSGFLGGDIFKAFKLPRLETEELLLLAAAAFLFFSKDGDKECAILILLLVFLG